MRPALTPEKHRQRLLTCDGAGKDAKLDSLDILLQLERDAVLLKVQDILADVEQRTRNQPSMTAFLLLTKILERLETLR